MPEGPSLVILKEETARFVGQEIVRAAGNTTAIDTARLVGQPVLSLRTWGKHFLIEMPEMVVRIHFLLFGSYRVDERRDKPPRLALGFADGGELNLYACSVKEIDADIETSYDWGADVMSDQWDPAGACKKLRAAPDMLVCDALLDQSIFSGVGNIIKNEVLFRIRVHPLSTIGALSPAKLRTGTGSAPVQLRLPGVEEGICTEEALAGACEDDLSALPYSLQKGPPGPQQPPQLFLRALPETLQLNIRTLHAAQPLPARHTCGAFVHNFNIARC